MDPTIGPPPSWAQPAADVDEALTTRKSIRAFLPRDVPEATVRELLAVASRAPSGTNTQPWRVRALAGEHRSSLSRAILASLATGESDAAPREPHYPERWPEPYLARRRKVGWDLYGMLGISRDQRDRIEAQRNRNFVFFDAPVGLIITIDERLKRGSWLDVGMFLQSIMLAARARGLATCPQAAFSGVQRVIRDHLKIPSREVVVCGMALGFADPSATVNGLVTEREPVDDFASFEGFGSTQPLPCPDDRGAAPVNIDAVVRSPKCTE